MAIPFRKFMTSVPDAISARLPKSNAVTLREYEVFLGEAMFDPALDTPKVKIFWDTRCACNPKYRNLSLMYFHRSNPERLNVLNTKTQT